MAGKPEKRARNIYGPILNKTDLAKMVRTLKAICEWNEWAGPGTAVDAMRLEAVECLDRWPHVGNFRLIGLKRQFWSLMDQLQEGQ